uniref:Uncharacterized protein n=1 Tax=Dulem virus 36 TaxID=3145754 RepID=A0AAU8B200_9CAUD
MKMIENYKTKKYAKINDKLEKDVESARLLYSTSDTTIKELRMNVMTFQKLMKYSHEFNKNVEVFEAYRGQWYTYKNIYIMLDRKMRSNKFILVIVP